MKPILKWAGGKTQLLKEIDKLLPNTYNDYFEPFIGGASVLLHISPENGYINDYNKELVNVYKIIKNKPNELIEDLQKHINSKEYFLDIRKLDRNKEEYNKLSDIKKASRFIYLNKTCFNGLYRVNKKNEFNVPFGNYKNPNICNKEVIIELSKFFNENNIIIHNSDFEKFLTLPQKGDFVYLDPPYDPLTESSSFAEYSENGFNKEDQKRLKKCCDELNARGVKFLLSNSSTDFIKELYSDYNITIVKARRNINSNGENRGYVDEVLIKNY